MFEEFMNSYPEWHYFVLGVMLVVIIMFPPLIYYYIKCRQLED